MTARAAFIGLGVMGYPMAAQLQATGHPLTVYNRTRELALRWVDAHGGVWAASPAEAAAAGTPPA